MLIFQKEVFDKLCMTQKPCQVLSFRVMEIKNSINLLVILPNPSFKEKLEVKKEYKLERIQISFLLLIISMAINLLSLLLLFLYSANEQGCYTHF